MVHVGERVRAPASPAAGVRVHELHRPRCHNMVTGAATATVNRIPVLLLPGDVFATRRVTPVLQQLEPPESQDLSVNDAFRPVSRYWDRIDRPEQLVTALPAAFRVLMSPSETGAVTVVPATGRAGRGVGLPRRDVRGADLGRPPDEAGHDAPGACRGRHRSRQAPDDRGRRRRHLLGGGGRAGCVRAPGSASRSRRPRRARARCPGTIRASWVPWA